MYGAILIISTENEVSVWHTHNSITLTNEEVLYLQSPHSVSVQFKREVVDRAKMLLYKAQGASNSDIAERLDVNMKHR